MRRRPASITVFAVLNMVFGGLGLLSPLVIGIFMSRNKVREVFEPKESDCVTAFD